MITVLFGSNRFALRRRLNQLVQDFENKYSSAGVERYAAENIDANNLGSVVAGGTLFSVQKLVIITDLSSNKQLSESFEKLAGQVSEDAHIVLVEAALDKRTLLYKTLKKTAQLEEFTEMDEAAAASWVAEEVKKASASISASDSRLLVQYVGSDQLRLANELAKLVAYDPAINVETIDLLVEKKPQETIFQLLEYALSGKIKQAMSVLEGLERAHEDPFQVANMLIWQVHILAIVSSSDAPVESQIAKDAKLNPFVVKKTKMLTAQLSALKVSAIIDATAELDIKLKTSSGNPWRLLESTLLAI